MTSSHPLRRLHACEETDGSENDIGLRTVESLSILMSWLVSYFCIFFFMLRNLLYLFGSLTHLLEMRSALSGNDLWSQDLLVFLCLYNSPKSFRKGIYLGKKPEA